MKYLGVEGDPTQITRTEKSPSNMKWSPDGSYLAFTMFVPDNDKIKIDIPCTSGRRQMDKGSHGWLMR